MRCNDCINYKPCKLFGENIFGNHYEYKVEEVCEFFKDKSLFVELPCKVGDTLYFGNYKGEVVENEILDIRYRTKTKSGFYNDISIDKVGKTVYVTRQEGQDEAERKLREVGE